MRCKHCQAELEEGVSVCPNCGEVQVEHFVEESESPKNERKNPSWLVGLTVALGALVLIVMVAVIVFTVNRSTDLQETEPVEDNPGGVG